MPNDLIVQKEEFPLAQVPSATSLEEVFAAWKERGLKPVELTQEETVQRIVIEHDPLKGKLKWTASPNMDGMGVVLHAAEATILMPAVVTAEGAVSIAEYFLRGEGKIDLGTGSAAVMLAFKDGRLAIDYEPKTNGDVAAKKMLAAAFLSLVAKDAGIPIENIIVTLSGPIAT